MNKQQTIQEGPQQLLTDLSAASNANKGISSSLQLNGANTGINNNNINDQSLNCRLILVGIAL